MLACPSQFLGSYYLFSGIGSYPLVYSFCSYSLVYTLGSYLLTYKLLSGTELSWMSLIFSSGYLTSWTTISGQFIFVQMVSGSVHAFYSIFTEFSICSTSLAGQFSVACSTSGCFSSQSYFFQVLIASDWAATASAYPWVGSTYCSSFLISVWPSEWTCQNQFFCQLSVFCSFYCYQLYIFTYSDFSAQLTQIASL